MLSALLDPTIFKMLITNGEGGPTERPALDTGHGVWSALLVLSLTATFALAVGGPQRVVQPRSVPDSGALAAEVTSR